MDYLLNHPQIISTLLLQHLQMIGWALSIAVVAAVPLALLVTHVRWLNIPIMGVLGVLYTVPSLALIILLVPIFGLNAQSVIVAIVLYTQVILVRNLAVGLESINPAVLEAARGMGMNGWQRWWRIQAPLILPIFIAGVRLAAVIAIAIATIGAKFNAGGLGALLFEGIQTTRYDKIWAGAIAVALLALAINAALLGLEDMVSPAKKMQSSH